MDDILKKTMYKEVQDLLDQISSVVEKYNYSEELIYTAAFGMLEEEGEMNRWTLAYGWNCRDMDEFGEFMAYYVGMKAGAGKVCVIKEDDHALYKYNVRRYHVYLEDKDSTYIWKTVENQPVLIEYDCNFE